MQQDKNCFLFPGCYTGIATKLGGSKNDLPHKRTPFKDITNTAIAIFSFEGLSALGASVNCNIVGSWSASSFENAFVISQSSGFCLDGFIVLKSVAIHRDLSFAVKFGNPFLKATDFHFPGKLLSLASIISLLHQISALKLCLGYCSKNFGVLGDEIVSPDGNCVGVKKLVSRFGAEEPAAMSYFSTDCSLALPFDCGSKRCRNCSHLASLLSCRLCRSRLSEDANKDLAFCPSDQFQFQFSFYLNSLHIIYPNNTNK